MCGLLAMLTANGAGASFVEPVERALPCMYHRGPDAAGTWNDADAVFGFNRLAIIDIEHSHQPLRWGPEDNPQRYALTFNGEIYNLSLIHISEPTRRHHVSRMPSSA